MWFHAFQWDLAHIREAAFVNKVGVSSCLTCCGVKRSRCGQQYSSSQKCTVYTGDKAITNQWPASFWTRKNVHNSAKCKKAYTALQSQHNRKQWGIMCSAAWQWLIRNCLVWVSVAGQTEEGCVIPLKSFSFLLWGHTNSYVLLSEQAQYKWMLHNTWHSKQLCLTTIQFMYILINFKMVEICPFHNFTWLPKNIHLIAE